MPEPRTDLRETTAAVARFLPGAAASTAVPDVTPPSGLAVEALARWHKDLEVFGRQALAASP